MPSILILTMRLFISTILVTVFLAASPLSSHAFAADPCAPGSNPIVCENSKPGTPAFEWDIIKNGDLSIQGFATDMSVNAGETIGFKIDTDATDYSLLIYRMGWYGGDGARLVDTVQPSATLPQIQPDCLVDFDTDLTDCGNWGLSAAWDVPADAVSGVYIARPLRADDGGDSHILFIVRDDGSTSDILFQTSDTTWQAYNTYGASTYAGVNLDRAYKVSYNRPFFTRGGTPDGRDSFFGSEYAMLRWVERNGYDVSYVSGVDTDRMNPSRLLNHNVFLSVGHDEYWSGQQRANVEAARDAGVNLIFASGNEVYWKTRWEPSTDGSNTNHRTMVVYKETLDSAKIDPSPEWTGTWRDPRFSPPSDGGRPENSLTGTLFTVNCCTFALKVPAEYGNLRFWRNTSISTLAPGTEKVFPMGTLGYEWDEDIDNGFRPPGAFRMSRTTEIAEQRLIDFGQTVAEEEATHHLMMYRASSGALVFGAGTVQWSWGLDDYHDGPVEPVDQDMQQATVNVLADMGVQPDSLENGLVAAAASSDTTAPTTVLSLPGSGQAYTHGDTLTVSGTASDAGGGVVAAVEVSLNGGVTWHPADGRANWSYTGALTTRGTQTVMARASDDSGNLGHSVSTTVDVDCPCQIFGDNATPKVASFVDSTQLELGVKFQSDLDGWISGVRFYKGPANTGTHVGSLWSDGGELLASGTFVNESATGWQELTFGVPVAITADTTYVASYNAPNGGYSGDTRWFEVFPTISAPLRAIRSSPEELNGVFSVGPALTFPTSSFGSSNYWVDVVFNDVQPPDSRAPEVAAVVPVDGASSVSTESDLIIVVDESIDPSTVVFTVSDSNQNGVAGTVSYDDSSLSLTFSPSAPLANAEAYSVTASFNDVAGNALEAPVSFSFETAQPDGAVSALWDDSAVPEIIDSGDANSIELGVKFVADADLDITGVRFYKSQANTGTHVGSLWDAAGALLAQTTFVGESTTGWQEATFSAPVQVIEGQTYIVSYFSPAGHYSATNGFFNSAYDSGPLTAPSSADSGGNGVFAYSSTSAFPTNTANSTNYWVSPLYEELPDTQAPVVVATSPADGATSVVPDANISVVFDEPLDDALLSISVVEGASTAVAGAVSYNTETYTASFVSDEPMASGSEHTIVISATDLVGNSTASPLEFSFVTASDIPIAGLWDDTEVPATLDSGDTNSVEVGVKFIPETDLDITGIRFYKSLENTGTHVGSLWDASGELLAQVTFTGESTSGWQEASFTGEVSVLEGQTYIASYFAPAGGYSATGGYFDSSYSRGPLTVPATFEVDGNGVFSYAAASTFPTSSYNSTNYWVTPVYVLPPDVTAPSVISSTPADGESSVPTDSTLAVVFDEDVVESSIDLVLKASDGSTLSGSVSYDDESFTASLTPSSQMLANSSYSLEVTATDLAGNAISTPLVFSFLTASDIPIAGLWDDSVKPATADAQDPASIEVGVKFVPAIDMDITGIRFYKSISNTGTHTGTLWDESGSVLAQATFGAESSAGWQQAVFSTPVRVLAGQIYVVSYFAPNGHYSATTGFFGATHTNGPLSAPASANVGGNGVYAYSSNSTFPSTSSNGTNYWVTPIYELPGDTGAPSMVATTPLDDSSSVSVNTLIAVVVDEPLDPSSIVFDVSDGSANVVSGTVSYDESSLTVSFAPASPLTNGDTYSVSVSLADTAGNTIAAPVDFSFVTALADGAVAGLWDDSTIPDTVDSGDPNSIEIGLKFTSDSDLDITGVRFYKALANTGAHIGSLWNDSGALLAQVTLNNETSNGWQVAQFSDVVRIIAGQTYVVSYFAPDGHYSATGGYFDTALTNGPLTALASTFSSGNGVYAYSDNTTFPEDSFNNTNYWITPTYELPSTPPPSNNSGVGLWDDVIVPDTVDAQDASSIELGIKFVTDTNMPITGVRFYKSLANTGPHVGSLWDSSGSLLARVNFSVGADTGWQEAVFSAPVQVIAGQSYVVSYFAPNGHYSASGGYFSTSISNGPVTAPASGDSGGNGVFLYGPASAFPTSSFNDTNYWVSPLFELP